jgi:hypothetical protein
MVAGEAMTTKSGRLGFFKIQFLCRAAADPQRF